MILGQELDGTRRRERMCQSLLMLSDKTIMGFFGRMISLLEIKIELYQPRQDPDATAVIAFIVEVHRKNVEWNGRCVASWLANILESVQ